MSNSIIPLGMAARKWDRQFSDAVRRSIPKTLTEPITNSWDSYKRLGIKPSSSGLVQRLLDLKKNEKVDHRKLMSGLDRTGMKTSIKIHLCTTGTGTKEKRLCMVIDHAEGMGQQQLLQLCEYGDDTSGQSSGASVRGLFGQGLSDVIFGHQEGQVISIKDGFVSEVRAARTEDNKPGLDPIADRPATSALRKKYGIAKNGTVVRFILEKECHIPNPENIYKKLCDFYMLRLINADPSFDVTLEQVRRDKTVADRLNYQFPNGLVVGRFDTEVSFQGYDPFKVECVVVRADEPLVESKRKEEREGGLLVVDECDTVYDLTLLDFDNDPGLERIYGVVRLTGFREIAQDRLNYHKEALITESRDGFDNRLQFFELLKKGIRPRLKPIIEEEKRHSLSTESTGISSEVKKRLDKAFKELNSLYQDETGDTGSGEGETKGKWPDAVESIAFFPKNSITLRVNKPHYIHLLVNKTVAAKDGTIVVDSDSSDIVIQPDETSVETGKEVSPGINAYRYMVSSTVIGASAKVDALVDGKKGGVLSAVLNVNDVRLPPELLPPADGIEFRPSYASASPHRKGSVYLLVDLDKVPLGSDIHIRIETNTEGVFFLSATEVEITAFTHTLKKGEISPEIETLARIPVYFRGHRKGLEAKIGAKVKVKGVGKFQDTVIVEIKDPGTKRNGVFQGLIYRPSRRKVAAELDPTSGKVVINSDHLTNRAFFGPDQNTFNEKVENDHPAQVRLAELLTEQAMYHTLAIKYLTTGKKGWSPNEDDPVASVRTQIEEWKFDRSASVFREIVTGFRIPSKNQD
jgi:hypothetical protein